MVYQSHMKLNYSASKHKYLNKKNKCMLETNSIWSFHFQMQMRENILTMALEYNMLSFIMKCVQDWSPGGKE